MTELFGVIVAGRAIQTNFVQAGENELVVELPNSESINHIVVFLTGVQLFPEGVGGSGEIKLACFFKLYRMFSLHSMARRGRSSKLALFRLHFKRKTKRYF